MCGIAGKVSSGSSVPEDLIARMCAAQEHRGPDSRGIHSGEGVGLGIQRLRVIDLETGDQPIYNEDHSVAVVLNGEIYNYRELRDDLRRRGHTFVTEGDTEVIVHLYEEHGRDLVKHLNGMFAFALWDDRKRELLLARDRVGKKPLYYSARGAELSFASELAALMMDESIPREIDPSSVDEFLAFGYIQAPASIWRDVRKLPPAHTLTWHDGDVRLDRYWRLDYSQKIDEPQADLEAELRRLIAEATKRRMLADVPLGAFLSGGVDSSVVVSEMAFASSTPIKTFSIGFDDEAYNELPNARLVAERFGTDHHEFKVRTDAVELLPKLVRHYGEPYADSSAIPSFYLAEQTRKHVTVALNGDGGDESFAGYLRHPANAMTAWVDGIPSGFRRGIASASRRVRDARDRRSARVYARRYLTTLGERAPDRYASHVGIFDDLERCALLDPDYIAGIDPDRTRSVIHDPWSTATGSNRLDVLLQTDVETYLPGDLLTKIDIATMACSLEARSPFLDPEVMEFAASLPAAMKARFTSKKRILRSAYADRLPAEILGGPKRGFAVPIGSWLRNDLNGWAREVLLSREPVGGMLRREEVERILDEHQYGHGDHSLQIWSLLCLTQWHEEMAPAMQSA